MARINYLKPWRYRLLLGSYFCPLCVLCKQLKVDNWPICRYCWQIMSQHIEEQEVLGVRSLFVYKDSFKELLLDFKKKRHYFLHIILAKWLWQALPEKDSCVVVLVPCSEKRRKREGVDPLCLIGRDLASWGVVVCSPFYKKGLSQKILKKEQRIERIKNSIFLQPKQNLKDLEGKKVVIVDDLVTTGATLNEIETRLNSVGVASLSKLVLARTPYEEKV